MNRAPTLISQEQNRPASSPVFFLCHKIVRGGRTPPWFPPSPTFRGGRWRKRASLTASDHITRAFVD